MPPDTIAAAYAVIIPHFNDPDRLARCLAALETQDRAATEVVVADNGSDLDLSPLQARFGWVRWAETREPGAGPARNCGVAATTAPWLLFLDADCVPAAGWLDAAKRAATDPGTATGGRITVFDETPPPRSGAEAFETVFAFDQQNYIETKGFSVTANLVVARADFEAVGPFRAGVSEDLDWGRRARAAGVSLRYAVDLEVAHPTRADWPALRRKWRRLTAEGFALDGQGRGRVGWVLKGLAMPVSILAHVPKILTHGALSPGDKARALGTLVRLRLLRAGWMLRQGLFGASL